MRAYHFTERVKFRCCDACHERLLPVADTQLKEQVVERACHSHFIHDDPEPALAVIALVALGISVIFYHVHSRALDSHGTLVEHNLTLAIRQERQPVFLEYWIDDFKGRFHWPPPSFAKNFSKLARGMRK